MKDDNEKVGIPEVLQGAILTVIIFAVAWTFLMNDAEANDEPMLLKYDVMSSEIAESLTLSSLISAYRNDIEVTLSNGEVVIIWYEGMVEITNKCMETVIGIHPINTAFMECSNGLIEAVAWLTYVNAVEAGKIAPKEATEAELHDLGVSL